MRIVRTAGLVAVAVVVAVTAACAGDQSEPEDVTQRYLQATVDKDWTTTCELVSTDGRTLTDEQISTCVEEAEKYDTHFEGMEDEVRDKLGTAIEDGPEEVEIEDDTATVTYPGGAVIELVMISGRWYVDG